MTPGQRRSHEWVENSTHNDEVVQPVRARRQGDTLGTVAGRVDLGGHGPRHGTPTETKGDHVEENEGDADPGLARVIGPVLGVEPWRLRQRISRLETNRQKDLPIMIATITCEAHIPTDPMRRSGRLPMRSNTKNAAMTAIIWRMFMTPDMWSCREESRPRVSNSVGL
jgi:hypothetical protein